MLRTRYFRCLVALGVAGASAGALAQGSQQLEEIVVTGQKLQGNVQDIPIALSAFDSAQLERLTVRRTADIVPFTPGLSMTPGPNGGTEALFYIRGVGQNDGNAANDPGVGVYLDGVYMGRPTASSMDMLDIERVEVLRGPQGTLFGRNTIGGAINIITARPDTESVSGKVMMGIMERGGHELSGTVNLPLADTLAMRLTGMTRKQDGWGKSVYTSDTFGDVDVNMGRLKLLFEPNDRFSAELSADVMASDGTTNPTVLAGFNPAGGPPPGGASPLAVPFIQAMGQERSDDVFAIFSSVDPVNEADSWGAALTLRFAADAFDVTSITAWRDLETLTGQDFDGGGFAFYDNYMDQKQDQFSQELIFSGSLADDSVDWLFGLYYFEEDIDYNNQINLGHNVNLIPGMGQRLDGRGLTNNQRFAIEVESKAVFGSVTWNISPEWALSLGARWNKEDKSQSFDFFIDNTDNILTFIPIFPPGGIYPTLSPNNPVLQALGVPTSYSESWDEVSPKVVLDYKPRDDLMLYVSYTEGFKSGGWNGRPQNVFASVPTYEPEYVDTYEFGWKSEWLDRRVQFNGAVFFTDYTDIQLFVLNPATGFFDYVNAAEAEVTGIELDIQAVPIPNLNLYANATWTDGDFKTVTQAAEIAGITKGNEFPLLPEYTFAVGGAYTWDLGDQGQLTGRADYNWRDDQFFSADNAPLAQQDSYGLLNLRLTWDAAVTDLSLSAYLLNVSDREYANNGQDVMGGLGVAFLSYGPPRQWGLEAQYRF